MSEAPRTANGGTLTTINTSVFAPDQPANIDSRLTDKSDDQIVESLRSLTVNDNDLPVRPGFGTSGTPIKLRTNFFTVKVPKGPLYEYDVAINPAVSIKRVKRRIFQLAELTSDWANAGMTGRVAHDHASKLIAATTLPQPLVIRVLFTDEDADQAPAPQQPAKPKGGKKGDKKPGERGPKEYTLTIKFVQELETESLLKYVLYIVHTAPTGMRKVSEVAYTRNLSVRVSSTSGACIFS